MPKDETVITYLLKKPDLAIPMPLGEFYQEQIKESKKRGKPTRAR